jgi:hypothetical protein
LRSSNAWHRIAKLKQICTTQENSNNIRINLPGLPAELLLLAVDEGHGANCCAPAWALAACTAGHTGRSTPELSKGLQIHHTTAQPNCNYLLMHIVCNAVLLCLLV